MNNPLVAERHDSTQSFSGVPILESANDTSKAIQSGDWAGEVLGATGIALDALTMAMDPFGAVLAAGVGWLMEHVGPLSEALDGLTGDADQVQAHSETWKNISGELDDVRTEMENLVKKDIADWTGAAGDAYRARSADTAKLLDAAKTAADGAADGLKTAGEVVAAVRTLVRDIISELIGHLISWALQVVATLGIGMTWVLPQVVSEVAKVSTRIAELTAKLVRAMSKLSPMLRKLADSFDDAAKAFKKGKPGSSERGPSSTTSAGSHKPPDAPPSQGGKGTGPGDDGGHRGLDEGGPPPPLPKTGGAKTTPAGSNGPKIKDNNKNPHENDKALGDRKVCGDPIDVATGHMVLSQQDVELPGVLPLVVQRTHVSSYRVGRFFGASWASTLDQRLEFDYDGLHLAVEDGRLLSYPVPVSEAPVLPTTGQNWRLERTESGYVVTDSDADRLLFFDAADGERMPLRAILDGDGNRMDLNYDEAGIPTELGHSGGYRIAVDTSDGLITALRLLGTDEVPDITLMRYRYDERRRLTEVINSSDEPLRFEYDVEGRITRWTDRNGVWYRYSFDAAGRCVRGESLGGYLGCELSYDRENLVTRFTNSLDETTTYQLDDRLRVVSETDPSGHTTTFEFDSGDRLLSHTDPLGRTTRYDYDERGDLVAVTRADGSQTLLEYDESRLPVTVVAPDGMVSRREYDELGRLVRTIDPVGAVTLFAYDERGHLSRVTDALGGTREVSTDAAGLPVAVADGLGALTRYERDRFGRVTAMTDPAGSVTRFGWTVDGKPAWRMLPDGAIERWFYDGEGNLRTHVDSIGQTTHTEVAHFDLPCAEVRPDGTRLRFGYDTELRLTSVTNQQGLVWRYEYDTTGNLVRETDFNGRMLTYRHDAAGQLIERTNGAGETTRFTHDAFGNVVERRSGGKTSTFTYDPLGRLIEATNPEGQVAFRRDPAGRVLTETINGHTTASVYDPLGRRIRRRTPSGAESVWDYDANSRPVALHTAGRTLRFDYDGAGNEIRRQLGRDAVLAQSWDANHRLLSQSLTAAAERRIQQRSYTYRADGFLAAMDDRLTGPRKFDLDRTGRVTAVTGSGWTERYAYDAAGNVANASWPTSPAADAEEIGDREYSGTLVRRAGKVRYEHDAQGRVVLRQRKRLSHRPETWRYLWDADDQLSEVLTPDGTRWRYRYDPLGRRIAKQRLAPDGSRVVEQVEFVWDGLVLAEQAHTDGLPNGPDLGDARVTAWNYEPGTSRPLTQTERSPLRQAPQQWIDEQFYSIVTDLVGTPTELIDDKGDVAWFHRTTLWGATTDQSRECANTPLRFPGQYHDPETGLNYNFYRHYDPVSGRYTSADPIGLEGGTNPHQYVPNPHTWLDPLGLTPCLNEQIAEHSRKRADMYHGLLPLGSQGRGTTAVIAAKDSEKNYWNVVSGSGDGVSKGQRETAEGVGDVVAPATRKNSHAEMNALAEIRGRNWTPVAGGASRNVCTPCGTNIHNSGATLGGPLFRGNGSGENYFFW